MLYPQNGERRLIVVVDFVLILPYVLLCVVERRDGCCSVFGNSSASSAHSVPRDTSSAVKRTDRAMPRNDVEKKQVLLDYFCVAARRSA